MKDSTSRRVKAPVKSLICKKSSNFGNFLFFFVSFAEDTVVPEPGPMAGLVLDSIFLKKRKIEFKIAKLRAKTKRYCQDNGINILNFKVYHIDIVASLAPE